MSTTSEKQSDSTDHNAIWSSARGTNGAGAGEPQDLITAVSAAGFGLADVAVSGLFGAIDDVRLELKAVLDAALGAAEASVQSGASLVRRLSQRADAAVATGLGLGQSAGLAAVDTLRRTVRAPLAPQARA